MTHRNESPQKVQAIKDYLSRAFEGREVRYTYESDRGLHTFRIDRTSLGPVSLAEEYFFDLPENEQAIFVRLTEARLPHAIRETDEHTRAVILWDDKVMGRPRFKTEPLELSQNEPEPR